MVPVTLITPSTSTPQTYSDRIPDSCVGSFDISNSSTPSCHGSASLNDPYQILRNDSSQRQIVTETLDASRNISFLAPARPPANLDFKASTVAISSLCHPISRECNLGYSAIEYPENQDSAGAVAFNCSDNFQGELSYRDNAVNAFPQPDDDQQSATLACLENGIGCATFFQDTSLNISLDDHSHHYILNTSTDRYANPFYAGIFGSVDNSAATASLETDAQMLSTNTKTFFVLGCEITVYDLTYTRINGSNFPSDLTLASDAIAAV
ncbi:MAG: hypothetical protein L6R39_004747, partial [Caloplaca ligustica]